MCLAGVSHKPAKAMLGLCPSILVLYFLTLFLLHQESNTMDWSERGRSGQKQQTFLATRMAVMYNLKIGSIHEYH